jgi:hypothetical protein
MGRKQVNKEREMGVTLEKPLKEDVKHPRVRTE